MNTSEGWPLGGVGSPSSPLQGVKPSSSYPLIASLSGAQSGVQRGLPSQADWLNVENIPQQSPHWSADELLLPEESCLSTVAEVRSISFSQLEMQEPLFHQEVSSSSDGEIRSLFAKGLRYPLSVGELSVGEGPLASLETVEAIQIEIDVGLEETNSSEPKLTSKVGIRAGSPSLSSGTDSLNPMLSSEGQHLLIGEERSSDEDIPLDFLRGRRKKPSIGVYVMSGIPQETQNITEKQVLCSPGAFRRAVDSKKEFKTKASLFPSTLKGKILLLSLFALLLVGGALFALL